jgi:peptide chain release factor 3
MNSEIARRRTFAIVSHPDAGKTTLTEKFLLYGGAVHLAGSVTARKNQRATTSDWMELERQRGISINSTVLQFEYGKYCVNLLDTPGHRDFSEDTYRVLTAVDSALMIIDAGKGIESRTRKLFEVCRQRGIPIFTFMNKMDRPSLEPLALLDELESVLGLAPWPVNWPLGNGADFRGVFDRRSAEVSFYERTPGGAYVAPVEVHDMSHPAIEAALGEEGRARVVDELALLDGTRGALDPAAVLAGVQTPVFFGSAINNFGVQKLLDGFLEMAPPPGPRQTVGGVVEPDDPAFSGFIFKIQANMDPNHRDRLAFVRVCSGRFQKDIYVVHSGSGERVRLASSHRVFGRERESIDDACAGDVIGIIGRSEFRIGDTLTENPDIRFDAIPTFSPECFAWIHVGQSSDSKRFRRGMEQLLEEGVVQSFLIEGSQTRVPLLGAVGPLQFEVVQFRLQSEYGADSRVESAPWSILRWIVEGEVSLDIVPSRGALVTADDGRRALLFPDEWSLGLFQDRNPTVRLRA